MNNENNNGPFQRGEMETAQPEVTLGVSPKPIYSNENSSVGGNVQVSSPSNNVVEEQNTQVDINGSTPNVSEPINIANPTPISETPASEPKKKGKGGLIIIILVLLIIVAALLIFVFDVFGLKNDKDIQNKENEKTNEVSSNNDAENNNDDDETNTNESSNPINEGDGLSNNLTPIRNSLDLENETKLTKATIANSEVKKLYKYVKASADNNFCEVGNYYNNPFKIDDDYLIELALYRYAIKEDPNYHASQMGASVSEDYVYEGLKYLFNINKEDITFVNEKQYGHSSYSNSTKSFIIGTNSGFGLSYTTLLYGYEEKDDGIYLREVKAEGGSNDGGIFRYEFKKSTYTYDLKDFSNFYFTEENKDSFEQIEYVFKKNDEGKYYLSAVNNLNFIEDTESCVINNSNIED